MKTTCGKEYLRIPGLSAKGAKCNSLWGNAPGDDFLNVEALKARNLSVIEESNAYGASNTISRFQRCWIFNRSVPWGVAPGCYMPRLWRYDLEFPQAWQRLGKATSK